MQFNGPVSRRPLAVRARAAPWRPATKAPRRPVAQPSAPPASAGLGAVLSVVNAIAFHPFLTGGTAWGKAGRLTGCWTLFFAAIWANENIDLVGRHCRCVVLQSVCGCPRNLLCFSPPSCPAPVPPQLYAYPAKSLVVGISYLYFMVCLILYFCDWEEDDEGQR